MTIQAAASPLARRGLYICALGLLGLAGVYSKYHGAAE